MSGTVGTVGLWVFCVSTVVVLLSISLKTKWWKSDAGKNVFALALWFFLTMTLIVLATLNLLPDWLKDNARALIYWGGALILLWRAAAVWTYNRGFWSWTKEDE